MIVEQTMELVPRQRGRAALQFASSLARATNSANRAVHEWLTSRGLDDDTLEADPDRRQTQVAGVLQNFPLYPVSTLCADWLWANHGKISVEGFEEILPSVRDDLDRLDHGPTTLHAENNFEPPEYHTRYWFHRTTGGWDGHDYMGAIQSEFVHKQYVTAKYGADIYDLRQRLLNELPEQRFGRILEMGTSAGYFTRALANKFPEAEIYGCDVSQKMLEQARRTGNEIGAEWQLCLAPAEDTGLPSESFDLVTSYALFHELPGEIINAVWDEAWRLLRPGGIAFMAEGMPLVKEVDRLTSWRYYHDWQRGGEPFAHDYAESDDAATATAAGFQSATHRTLYAHRPSPRFTLAQKPLAASQA